MNWTFKAIGRKDRLFPAMGHSEHSDHSFIFNFFLATITTLYAATPNSSILIWIKKMFLIINLGINLNGTKKINDQELNDFNFVQVWRFDDKWFVDWLTVTILWFVVVVKLFVEVVVFAVVVAVVAVVAVVVVVNLDLDYIGTEIPIGNIQNCITDLASIFQ